MLISFSTGVTLGYSTDKVFTFGGGWQIAAQTNVRMWLNVTTSNPVAFTAGDIYPHYDTPPADPRGPLFGFNQDMWIAANYVDLMSTATCTLASSIVTWKTAAQASPNNYLCGAASATVVELQYFYYASSFPPAPSPPMPPALP